jgi:hypothetical protein
LIFSEPAERVISLRRPFTYRAADIFPRHARQVGKVALVDFVENIVKSNSLFASHISLVRRRRLDLARIRRITSIAKLPQWAAWPTPSNSASFELNQRRGADDVTKTGSDRTAIVAMAGPE